MRRPGRIIGTSMKKTSVTLVALMLGLTGVVSPSQAAPTPVSFTFNFVGVPCEGCTVGGEEIKNGAVTFTSDTGSIPPGALTISNPKHGFMDANTVIVMRYKGKAVGSK